MSEKNVNSTRQLEESRNGFLDVRRSPNRLRMSSASRSGFAVHRDLAPVAAGRAAPRQRRGRIGIRALADGYSQGLDELTAEPGADERDGDADPAPQHSTCPCELIAARRPP